MRSAVALLSIVAVAAAGDVAIRGAKVYVGDGRVLDRATVVVRGGKIVAVGPNLPIPEGIPVRDATGQILIPGLVDTHSHLGVYARPRVAANADGNEATAPVQSLVRAIDAIYPADPGFRQALAGGITTAHIMPGSANVMGGQTALVKLRGKTVEEMLIDRRGRPGGMKMANGENPKRTYGGRNQAPATRMKIMALQREIFLEAQRYQKDPKERNLALEPVVEILERKRTVHFHTHRADDIRSALRLADEFGFELVLHHVTEAYLVADEIAKREVPCSLTLLDAPGGKPEAINLRYENAGRAERAGILVALNTDDPVTESRFFLRTAALAVRGGMTPEGALKAITLNPAKMLHMEDRIGSIEVGKDGDLVLLNVEPFSFVARVLATWIEGDLVYDRSREEDYRRATGGHHVRVRIPPLAEPIPPFAPAKKVEGEAFRDVAKFALRAGILHVVNGHEIHGGVVVVENGRIVSVGTEVPKDMPVFAARHVTPGLIDAHGTAGLSGAYNVAADQDHEERVGVNQAALRALDGFNPREPLLRYLLEHGVTILHAVPGPHAPIAGQSGVFRTDGSREPVKFPSALVFNLGESVKREGDQAPSTRMGTAAIIRRALGEAQNKPEKDEQGLERKILAEARAGRLPVLFVAHREDDLLTALRIMKEFGLKGSISQATEGYLVRDELKAAGVSVLAAPTMQRAGSLERFNTCLENAALLADAGVPLAITSGYESYVPKTRVVLFEAAVAAAYGLGERRALRAVTLDPARILGIDADYGSIEKGKVADLVCYDDDPFEYTGHVVAVFARGRLAYTRK